jgi:hypothetical protein
MSDQTNRPTTDPTNLTADQLREDIAETRTELGETLDAISARLDVKARASDKAGVLRHQAANTASQAKVQAAHAVDEAKRRAALAVEQARVRAAQAADQAKVRAALAADQAKVRGTHVADAAKVRATHVADQVKARTAHAPQGVLPPRHEGEHAKSTTMKRVRAQTADVTARARTQYERRPRVFYIAGAAAVAGAVLWLIRRRR